MSFIHLHDKGAIERTLRKNVGLHIYSLGDLDDFFWPHTEWYAVGNSTEINQIALLYSGQTPPVLLAFSENTEEMKGLLASLLPLLPPRFYAHLSLGLESVFYPSHHLNFHGRHLKMILKDRTAVLETACPDTFRLGRNNLEELIDFYRENYPANRFDPRMLDTEQYFGIRNGGSLVSVAGVHVYSPKYKVAALGNIATKEAFRNKGYGRQVVAATCRFLLETVCHIGLNVKADNEKAISCYRKLGFDVVAAYGEHMVDRR